MRIENNPTFIRGKVTLNALSTKALTHPEEKPAQTTASDAIARSNATQALIANSSSGLNFQNLNLDALDTLLKINLATYNILNSKHNNLEEDLKNIIYLQLRGYSTNFLCLIDKGSEKLPDNWNTSSLEDWISESNKEEEPLNLSFELKRIKTKQLSDGDYISEVITKSLEQKIISNLRDFKDYYEKIKDRCFEVQKVEIIEKGVEAGIINDKSALELYTNEFDKEKLFAGAALIILAGYKNGLYKEKPDISPYVENLLDQRTDSLSKSWYNQAYNYQNPIITRQEKLNKFYLIIKKAIEAKYITSEKELEDYLKKLSLIDNGYDLEIIHAKNKLKLIAFKHNAITTKPDISKYLNHMSSSFSFDLYSDIVCLGIETRLISNEEELTRLVDPMLSKKDDSSDVIKEYVAIISKATKEGIISDVIPFIQKIELESFDEWSSFIDEFVETTGFEKLVIGSLLTKLENQGYFDLYTKLLRSSVESNLHPIDKTTIDNLNAIASEHNLPPSFVANCYLLKYDLGLSEDTINNWFKNGTEFFEKLQIKNQEVKRSDQKIDTDAFQNFLSPALANFYAISEKITSQIVNNYLTQRSYLPMLRSIFETAAFLKPNEVKVLRDFYSSKEGSNFLNDPNFLLSLIGYIKIYQAIDISLSDFESDLKKDITSQNNIAKTLGERVISTLSKPKYFNVKITSNALSKERDLSKEWDFRYLGLLMSEKKYWKKENEDLFTVLIKATLEGKLNGLLYPPDYKKVDISEYGPQRKYITQARKIRRYNLNLLKEAEKLGIDVNKWINPNKTVPPVYIGSEDSQRDGSDILNDFRSKLKNFKAWIGEHPELLPIPFSTVEKKIGTWAKISSEPSLKLFSNITSLKSLESFLTSVKSKLTTEQMPVELADMEIIINEIKQYDPNNKSKKLHRIRFLYRSPGHDLVIGNKTGTCISLGEDAQATYEFILDLGTLFTVVEEVSSKKEPIGRLKAYSRSILVQIQNGSNDKTPALNHDTTSGYLAQIYEEELAKHTNKLAKAVGINIDDDFHRYGHGAITTTKVGGTLTNSYFTERFRNCLLEKISHPERLDNWEPKGGWKE